MSVSDDKVKRDLSRFTPDQQHVLEAAASMKLENKVMRNQLAELNKAYEDLWAVMILVIDLYPDKTMRIHPSQFKRFKEEYRIDRYVDEETGEVVLKLLTVHDEPTRNRDG